MRIIFPVILLIVLAAATGCKSSRETGATPSGEVQAQTPPKTPGSPATAPVQNVSGIEAVVESISDPGAQYTLKIFVVESTPLNGRMSIVESGQRIIVSPQYAADSTGRVNFDEPRNKRIKSLSALKTGESFKGKVAINRQGGYNIVDVDESK
jgi:hypothetical protein